MYRQSGLLGQSALGHGCFDEERFGRLVVRSEAMLEMLNEKEPDYSLLGKLLWRGSVGLLVAQSSAGKTIFSYRLSHNLAKGEPFMGMTPDHPLRVLHIDLESPEAVKHMCLDAITPVPGWDLTGAILGQDAQWLVSLGRHDLIIVDNLQLAYPVRDENDNAQAIHQISFFAYWAKATNAFTLLIHNTGKSDHQEKMWWSRGASARVDRADISMILANKTDGVRELEVVKSRFGNLGETIRYRWTGNFDYEVTEHTLPTPGLQREMEAKIRDNVVRGENVKRADLATRLGIELNPSQERLFERALTRLVERGEFKRPEYGYYERI